MKARKYPIKRQSSKKRNSNKKLLQVKNDIELEAISDNEYYCKGCGNTAAGLDKSHLVPVGINKALELEKKNMQLLCRECHIKWESGEIEKMEQLLCFDENMYMIQKLDYQYYRILFQKMKDTLESLFEE